jgi:hypothetical protein
MLVQIESATEALTEKNSDSPEFHLFETSSDLYKDSEKLLKFVIGGKSEEAVSGPQQDLKPEPRRSHARTNRKRNRRPQGKKA